MNTISYNRSYYLAHPELREKARERERQKRQQIRKLIKPKSSKSEVIPTLLTALAWSTLIFLLTFLLLREMAGFYGESEGSHFLGWLKAGALEGAVLLFSFTTHKKMLHRIIYKAIALGICGLSIYGMCSKQLSIGLGSIESKQINSRAISDAEKAIHEKGVQRDYLLTHGWVTAARKTEAAIDELRRKLDHLRATAVELKPVQAVTHSTVIQVLLRVFLMLSNILAAHTLGGLSRRLLKHYESFRHSSEISRRTFETQKRSLKLSRREGPPQRPRSGGEPPNSFDWFWKWFPIGERAQV